MKPIRQSIEIALRPEEVFSYATDFSKFPDWQVGAVSARPIGDSPAGPGARAAVTRKIGPGRFARTEVISRYHPARTWSIEGVGGPLTANVHGTIEPVRDGTATRLTIDMDFEGHGIGRYLIPGVARRLARKQLPQNLQNLKRILEKSL
ncbi:SRPBCC family protein [Paenarthrobacter sp. PH39-S1]|uniref:SRPBCC family protein n=1 Tax=Paenarthrobacter sp. PH39-S1 TaxID=3046204 RepID=UPI0024B9E636|nr:SRPBCC family protein [Paenarthrobacter sp. PH39-S1]MDJ0356594.1 SRPBCC family protein [Paenarthrobacter sp. PH39-S1]